MSEEQNNTEPVEIKAEPVAEPKAEAPVEPKVEASAPVEAPVGNSGATLQDALAGVLGGIKLESKPEAAKSETDAAPKPAQQGRPEGQRPPRPQGDRPPREPRPQGDRPQGDRPQGGDRGPRPGGGPPNRENRGAGGGDRGPRPGGDRPQGDRGPRPGGDRRGPVTSGRAQQDVARGNPGVAHFGSDHVDTSPLAADPTGRADIERKFRENKIEIPFPQHDLHLRTGNIVLQQP